MEEDVLQQEGWISCQNLLEETVEEERMNHLFERRVSYKKAVEQARKMYPDFCSTKNNNLDPKIQVRPKENEAIELDEFPNSDIIDTKPEEQSKMRRHSMQGSTIKFPLWTKGCQSLRKLFSVTNGSEPVQDKTQNCKEMRKFSHSVPILVQSCSHEKKKEEPDCKRTRAELGLLYILFRPSNKKL